MMIPGSEQVAPLGFVVGSTPRGTLRPASAAERTRQGKMDVEQAAGESLAPELPKSFGPKTFGPADFCHPPEFSQQ